MARTTPWARAARAIEEPIRPTPISASRLNSGFAEIMRLRLPQKFSERSHDPPVGFLAADRHAEAVRQVVGNEAAENETAPAKEIIRLGGGVSLPVGKMD